MRSWILTLLLLVAACGGGGASQDPAAAGPAPELDRDPGASNPPAQADDPADRADAPMCSSWSAPPAAVVDALDRLDVRGKIGQLLAVHVYGSDAHDVSAAQAAANDALYGVSTPAEVVQRWHVGGVVYLGRNTLDPARPDLLTRNTTSPMDTVELSHDLQAAAHADNGIGLLIGVDQEGGRVARVGAPATVFPPAQRFGTIGDPELAADAAAVTAAELRAIGINQNYAPVADVNVEPANDVIGDRSFGADPEMVSEMVAASVRATQLQGIAATVKHFPGHGDTAVDSHTGLPVIDHDADSWAGLDRPPFAAAVAGNVCTVMLGHLAFPAIDRSGLPATLSPELVGLLRDDLGFDGVVLTDSLYMRAVRADHSDESIAVGALLAGADVLLTPADLAAVVDALVGAVEDGTISMDRLDESVARVLTLKHDLGLLGPLEDAADAAAVLGSPDHRAVAEAVDDVSERGRD